MAMLPLNLFMVGMFFELTAKNQDEMTENDKYRLIFVIILFSGQTFGLFGAHLVHSMFSRVIHQKSGIKTLMKFDAFFQFRSLPTHWKMSNYIERFHTKKPYGYTYGKFGIVSLKGFAKV